MAEEKKNNPFDSTLTELQTYRYYDLNKLNDARIARLPYSIKVLLESAVRSCDQFAILDKDVEKILDWEKNAPLDNVEIPFKPSRVLLQDFTGVPAVVDLAAMRNAVQRLGGSPAQINPVVPADLVIDHSVQVDVARTPDALQQNLKLEMERNHERFAFLKWGASAFNNFLIVPPGSGIVHQVNLEYLARVVFDNNGLLYPDSVVGTDSHTTMINGLGVTGWGVGGIEAEAVMMGQAVSMVLPQVIGYKLVGKLGQGVTATDLVLTITEALRKKGVVEKFVEFYGPGLEELSLADRATIANMAPEYGATMGFFPVDRRTIEFLNTTGRDPAKVAYIESYLRSQGLFADAEAKGADPIFTDTLTLDLSTVVPCVAGPKRPHDRVDVAKMQKDFRSCLTAKVGFKGYGLSEAELQKTATFTYQGQEYTIKHGDVVIAAITSCTNTSNPSVMLGAAMLAANAVKAGLSTKPYIKTSLAPGSGVVTKYLEMSKLTAALDQLGFTTVGYGCTSCIGNSGELPPEVGAAIEAGDIVASAVLSGNRNFEGRVHALTRANYLASPPLVVAYALAGTVDIDFETQPIGISAEGKEVYLREIWPSAQDIQKVVNECVVSSMFQEVYQSITAGTDEWNALPVVKAEVYPWSENSTYIHQPPYFLNMEREPAPISDIKDAFLLLNLGDSITTDHISPAGNITKNSPAGRFLMAAGVAPKDFNTYGARRGNDLVMARGTFANTRLVNKFLKKPGPDTVHVPSGQQLAIYDAAELYQKAGQQVIVFGGEMYGAGSSRDWAAKGPMLQGVRAVIAKSFERIHRSNLVGMGVLPCTFKAGEDAESLGLTGQEQYSIDLTSAPLSTGQTFTVKVSTGKTFDVISRLDTEVEIAYYKNGGILNYVIRNILKAGGN